MKGIEFIDLHHSMRLTFYFVVILCSNKTLAVDWVN